MSAFDPSSVLAGLEKLWRLKAQFGIERGALQIYLNEIVSDRYALVKGMQLLRDELQFAVEGVAEGDVGACGADHSLPSVVTTVAHTNCGDRIHQGEAMTTYDRVVASRFATLSELGEYKVEAFSPTGGGTDDGATLAHVTIAHQLDDELRRRLYEGNARSFILAGFDLMTHVGRLDEGGRTTYGITRESPFRRPRAACGAIVGCLKHFNARNGVHRRLRRDLGDDNWRFLSTMGIRADDGTDVSAAVAAAIVAVRGMRNCLEALTQELDERGVGHVTASITVNRVSADDTIVYLGRGTVFGGEVRLQGVGTQAQKYSARMIEHQGDRRLELLYDGVEATNRPIATQRFARKPRQAPLPDDDDYDVTTMTLVSDDPI